jgi:predicted dehydrogenase
MLPALKGSGANLKYISSARGVNAVSLGKKYGFRLATTDNTVIWNDPEVDLVMITTRHDLHAEQIINSIEAGKHVFVEKPLALNRNELERITEALEVQALRGNHLSLSVGFNRRYSPHMLAVKKVLNNGPMHIIATMNAGFVAPESWVQDLKTGGGRIIGEACHYIDLCAFLTGSHVTAVCMNALGTSPVDNTDNASILLRFEDGSNAVINYFSNGSRTYPKERVEVFSSERTIVVENFRKTEAYGVKGFKGLRTTIDKGHRTQFHELIRHLREGLGPLISFQSLCNTTLASFAAIESMKEGKWIEIKS